MRCGGTSRRGGVLWGEAGVNGRHPGWNGTGFQGNRLAGDVQVGDCLARAAGERKSAAGTGLGDSFCG